METYTTLDGEVIGVSHLPQFELSFLSDALEAFRANVPWADFALEFTQSSRMPLVEGHRRITREVMDYPVYKAVRDLEDRLGIAQGELLPAPGDKPTRDPIADEFISVSEAAVERGVTPKAVYLAIERGDLIAASGRPTRVSVSSLSNWTVNETRQKARSKGKVRSRETRGIERVKSQHTAPRRATAG